MTTWFFIPRRHPLDQYALNIFLIGKVMAEKKKTEVKERGMIGLMIHSDGSARPNPGFAGWGIHGYIYEDVPPTKGTGNPDYVLTSNDYMSKTDKAAQPNTPLVTPLFYVDGYGGLKPDPVRGSTNNQGELRGAIEALRVALDHDIKRVRIWTDSKYVTGGFSHALKWRQNGWLKADRQPPANVEMWKEYIELYDEVKAKGIDMAINWNEGHVEGNFGNGIVDDLAFVGMRHATNGIYAKAIDLTPPEGYWKYDTERHPFISHRRMYYNTVLDHNTPGEYCIGEHDKEDDLAGKRMANGAYAYIRLEQPEKVLEEVRNHSCRLADGDDTVMIARLDYIYRKDVHDMISQYGHIPLNKPPQSTSHLDAVTTNREELVTREHNPPLLIQRCVNELSQLKQILDDYEAGNSEMVTTDLTPLIYESVVETNKKGEEKRFIKLRPEFKVGVSNMEAVVNHRHPDGTIRQATIDLLLGLDLLDRNALRRLEEMEPEVRLVTWLEEPQAFRFATIIKVKGASGIWAGTYSNLRLILN
jgi:ribonuclease HI